MATDEAVPDGESKQAKGGKARALKLSAEEKSESAKAAAGARWKWPKALYEAPLTIGDTEFDCAVLEGGIRVISESSFMSSMGMYYSGWVAAERTKDAAGADGDGASAVLPLFVSQKSLKPFIDKDLESLLLAPVRYRPSQGGGAAKGIKAEIIPKICNVWLKARDAARDVGRDLPKRQALIAQKAEILMRGLAEVGIIALIDEATGYQLVRPRHDLEEQLAKFLSENLRSWVRTFPADYFKHLCRLRGVEFRSDMQLPPYFGTLTNNLVYKRLAPGLVKRLKERRAERGSPGNKLHSWLSEDAGFPGVLIHLGTVVGLMKLHTDYDDFIKQLDKIASVFPDIPGLFDDPKDWKAIEG